LSSSRRDSLKEGKQEGGLSKASVTFTGQGCTSESLQERSFCTDAHILIVEPAPSHVSQDVEGKGQNGGRAGHERCRRTAKLVQGRVPALVDCASVRILPKKFIFFSLFRGIWFQLFVINLQYFAVLFLQAKIRPLEEKYHFVESNSPCLEDSDFVAKPFVLVCQEPVLASTCS
jgi:hypothetical protein